MNGLPNARFRTRTVACWITVAAVACWILVTASIPLPTARAEAEDEKAESSASAGEAYGTWSGFQEVDRCAGAWVIDRFVEGKGVAIPQKGGRGDSASAQASEKAEGGFHAQFQFFPPGTIIRDAVPFDTPDAKRYARHPGTCIMETVMAVHNLGPGDPALLEVARIVRDAELNKWGDRITPEAAGLERILTGLNELSRDEMDCLRRSFDIFDALYAAFRARAEG